MKTLQDFYDDVVRDFDDIHTDWDCEFHEVDFPDGIFQPFVLMFARVIPGYMHSCNEQEAVFVLFGFEYEHCELLITYQDDLLSVCFNQNSPLTTTTRKQSQIMASVFAQAFVYWYAAQSLECRAQLLQFYHEARDHRFYLENSELPEYPAPSTKQSHSLLVYTTIAGILAGAVAGTLLPKSGSLFGVYELISSGAMFGTLAWNHKKCSVTKLTHFVLPIMIGTIACTLSTLVMSFAHIIGSSRPVLFGERIFRFSEFLSIMLSEANGFLIGSWLVLPFAVTILLCRTLLPKVHDFVHIGNIGFLAATLANGASESKLHKQLIIRGWLEKDKREELLNSAREFSFIYHSMDRVEYLDEDDKGDLDRRNGNSDT